MYSSYQQHIEQFGKKETQIDRTNNSLGYSKENCRWVTPSENCTNRRPKNITSKND